MDSIRGALFLVGKTGFYRSFLDYTQGTCSFPLSLSMKFLHHRSSHDTIECEFLG